jgi:hypothetical protein
MAGEHIAGILGLILAVPIAGIVKIIFEYSLDKINDHEKPANLKVIAKNFIRPAEGGKPDSVLVTIYLDTIIGRFVPPFGGMPFFRCSPKAR